MLKKIVVSNYKSLEQVEIDFGPLTILVGPNNAGKSNIIDCLSFFKEEVAGKPAFGPRGGFSSIVWDGDLKRRIEIRLIADPSTITPKSPQLPSAEEFNCEVEFEGGPTHHEVTRERVSENRDGKEAAFFQREGSKYSVFSEIDGSSLGGGANALPNLFFPKQLMNSDWTPRSYTFVKNVEEWAFYQLFAPNMKEVSPVKRKFDLAPYGENIWTVLNALRTEHEEDYKEMEATVKAAFPEVESLTSGLTEQGTTFGRLKENGLSMGIPSWAFSDGVLYLTGLLLLLYNPEPMPLICIEEPETGLHPKQMEIIAEVLVGASDRSQLLVVTHSPYLLNFLGKKMDLKHVFTVWKEDGRTQVKSIAETKGVKEHLIKLGLGEMFYSGALGDTP